MHSAAGLKEAILTEMFGAGGFNWNEQADACEAFELVLKKIHEYYNSKQSCVCPLHEACQLNITRRITCRWPNCKGVKNESMETDVFNQLCYMRTWLEFVEK